MNTDSSSISNETAMDIASRYGFACPNQLQQIEVGRDIALSKDPNKTVEDYRKLFKQ